MKQIIRSQELLYINFNYVIMYLNLKIVSAPPSRVDMYNTPVVFGDLK